MRALRLAAAAAALAAVAGCSSGVHHSAAAKTTQARRADPVRRVHRRAVPPSPAQTALGLPPLRKGPVPGYVMIADRNNDRILIVDPYSRRVVWQFPRPGDVRPGQSFHDPDDAFFTPGYETISTNEEYNQTISEIDLRAHRIVWTYGHAGIRGSAYGYLSNPDDAYKLPNGLFMVADIENCRVLFIDRAKRVVREIGHAGSCGHDPPLGLSSPNGATPLPDGGVLVTEIGGWVDRIDANGHLRYTVRTPTTYPSDAQLLPNGNILVAGFDTPGRVDEITPAGRIVWTFAPSGFWSLDRPSLAVRWPNGMIAVTDDWHHRVLVIDPATKRVVWSYGHLNQPGTAPGYLNKPDGLDLLPAGTTTAAPAAPKRVVAKQVAVTRIGSLPAAVSKASAVALPNGKLLVLGGLVGGTSSTQILLGPPERLRLVGSLPAPSHDAAAALVGSRVLLFGGGEAVSVNTIVSVDPATGHAVVAGHLDEPLSDLGAVTIGGATYLVGGYTGSKYASAVLRYDGGGKTTTVARLPAGTRYAGVAALGGQIYVAGGLRTTGPTDTVWSVRPPQSVNEVATLPAPEDHAALAALGGNLYLIGGTRILRIAPSGSVVQVARLPQALTDPSAVTIGNRIVIVGGGTDAVYSFAP